MEPVLLGIISSLIGTFIFLVLSSCFLKIVLPWYCDKIYRGVRIDGQWTACNLNDEEYTDNDCYFHLKQNSDSVTGSFCYISDHCDTTQFEMFSVEGHIRDGYVAGTITPVAKDEIDAGAFVFRVLNQQNGMVLQGRLVGIDPEEDIINSSAAEFRKEK